jgi:hypothetical protein
VSADTSVLVRSGDTLMFHLLTSSFSGNAARLGMSRSPSQLDFAVVSASGVSGEFAATLESADREVSLAVGELTFHSGYFQGNGYSGEISTLQGHVQLQPALSETLLEASSIVLTLRNEGPDVRLGLAPYFLRQNLYASLSGGSLSVGAVPYLVDLESRTGIDQAISLTRAVSGTPTADVPEPGTGGLLLGGGVLLLALPALLAGMSHRAAIRR